MTRRIIWTDVETNGLSPSKGNVLLEVAAVITDTNLNIIDEGYNAVVKYTATEVKDIKDNTVPFVLDMHEKTGLWEKLLIGTPLAVLDNELLDYLSYHVPEPKSARLAGNSITLDRNFLEAFLPQSFQHFHYRSFDVSTVTGLAEEWLGIEPFKKKATHAAMDDILESIEELRYLRECAFGIK